MENSELRVMEGLGIFVVKRRLLEGDDPDRVLDGFIEWPGTEMFDQMESILYRCHAGGDVVKEVSKSFKMPIQEAMWLVLGLVYGAAIMDKFPEIRGFLLQK